MCCCTRPRPIAAGPYDLPVPVDNRLRSTQVPTWDPYRGLPKGGNDYWDHYAQPGMEHNLLLFALVVVQAKACR